MCAHMSAPPSGVSSPLAGTAGEYACTHAREYERVLAVGAEADSSVNRPDGRDARHALSSADHGFSERRDTREAGALIRVGAQSRDRASRAFERRAGQFRARIDAWRVGGDDDGAKGILRSRDTTIA